MSTTTRTIPRTAVGTILDLPDAGAQVELRRRALIENVKSLGDTGWNGGRYASNWYSRLPDGAILDHVGRAIPAGPGAWSPPITRSRP